MAGNTLYVPKTTDTYADALMAWGLAVVLEDALEQAGIRNHDEIVVEDGDTHYVICLPQAFRREWLCRLKARRFTYYLAQSRSQFTGTEGAGIIFLDEEYEKASQFQNMPEDTPENREAKALRKPHRLLSHFDAMTRLQADNVVKRIFELSCVNDDQYRALVDVVIARFSTAGSDLADWRRLIKETNLPTEQVTASSMLNPAQGKGANSLKPKGAAPGNIKADWVGEWLKIIGFHTAGAAAKLKDGREIRIAVLLPRRIRLRHHRAIFERFLPTYFGSSAVKLDCLSALRYAHEFLSYIREEPDERDALLGLRGAVLPDVVRGVLCAGFLKTSKFAFSISGVSGYDLPAWVRLTDDAETLQRYQEVISEHRRCIGRLDESRGEQVTMLQEYREWLSSGNYQNLFAFFAGYAAHRMRCAVDDKPCSAFTTTNLEVIFMNKGSNEKQDDLFPILQNEGFRNVATAIRKGTINAQYQRNQGNLPSGVDVHFGLSHELRRNATYRDKFIFTLCNFLNTYNLENLRVSSRDDSTVPPDKKYRRKNVETSDIEAIVQLTDKYGSELICGLLLAYGYARDPHEKGVSDSSPSDDIEGGTNE